MKTVKVLNEEIDALRYEAKGIFEAAKRADREMNEEESKRFDAITDKKTGEIVVLKKQLSEAEDRERAILEMSVKEKRERSLEEIDNEVNQVRPPRVLPTNGILPGNEPQDDQRVYHRMAKLKAFKSEREAYDSGMWLRAIVAREYRRDDKVAELYCQRKGLQITTAGNEGTGTAGGYLVPTQLSQTIIDVRESVGVIRRIFNIQPMTSDTLNIARRTGGLTVYYPGETNAITTSDKTWSQIELIAKKRSVAHQISQELQDDALISVVDDAVSEMAYALADKEDSEGVLGDGTGTYGGVQGLLNLIGSAGVYTAGTGDDTWAELDMSDFTGTMGKLPEKYSRDPVWICSANFYWSTMVRVQASAGGNNIGDLEMGPGQPRFLGRPVFFTDKMPRATAAATVHALFGTFSQGAILGERTGIRVGRSDDYAFLNDMVTLKASTRYDINIYAPGDATNAGAYVALKTAA